MQATFDQAAQVLRLLNDQGVALEDLQDIFSSGVLSDVALAARLKRLPTATRVTNEMEEELFRLRWLDAFNLGVYSQVSYCFKVDYDLPWAQLSLELGEPIIPANYLKTSKSGQTEVSGKVISFHRAMKLDELRRWARYYHWTLAEPRELAALTMVQDISVECPVFAAGVVLSEGGYQGVVALTGAASVPETCRLVRLLKHSPFPSDLSFAAGESFLVIGE
ncbi:MAG: hypothetical protein HYT46_03690 [Candidatus Vogelbacteria bacterium]|nr:hypothetical protein [Candidatus Vogelbacteria bacterium]